MVFFLFMKGEELTKKRIKLGFTREELARELKTTYTTVYRWENNERTIPNFLELALEALENRRKESEKNEA